MDQYIDTTTMDTFELTIKFNRFEWEAYLNGKEISNLAQIKLDLTAHSIRSIEDVQLVFNYESLVCPNQEKVI